MHSTISSKGQITIPAQIRQKYDLKTGDQVYFVENEQGEMMFFAKNHTLADLSKLLPRLPRKTVLTDAEIEKAIAQGWAGEIDLNDRKN